MKCNIVCCIQLADYGNSQYILSANASTHTNRIIFSSALLTLYDHEKYLNYGRFKYFNNKVWGNIAVITKPVERYHQGFFKNFDAWIDWININKVGEWFFTMDYNEANNEVVFKFDFADKTIATIFKIAAS